jgi:hypothetical protein
METKQINRMIALPAGQNEMYDEAYRPTASCSEKQERPDGKGRQAKPVFTGKGKAANMVPLFAVMYILLKRYVFFYSRGAMPAQISPGRVNVSIINATFSVPSAGGPPDVLLWMPFDGKAATHRGQDAAFHQATNDFT